MCGRSGTRKWPSFCPLDKFLRVSVHPQKIAKLEPSKTKCIAIKFGSTIAFTISFVLKISREKLSFVTFAFSSSFCRLVKTWVINKKQLLRVWQKFAGPQDTQAQWKCHRTNTNSKITAFCIRWVQFSHNIPCFLLPKPNPNPPPPPTLPQILHDNHCPQLPLRRL